jgi:hypothetical protein
MKNVLLITTILVSTCYSVNSQTLPAKINDLLKVSYPAWEITKGCFPDEGSKSFVSGDFNGDGKTDFAVSISKDNRRYTLALLANPAGYKAFNLEALNVGDDYQRLANLYVAKKGEVIWKNPESEYGGSFKINNDAVMILECEPTQQTFYWYNGKFVNVEADLIPKSSKELYTNFTYGSKGLPKELKNIGGWLVYKSSEQRSNYAISMIQRTVGKSELKTMLWLVGPPETFDAAFSTDKVFDVIDLPKLKNNEDFVMGGECYLNGKFDGEIFAVILNQNNRNNGKIVRAWRANTEIELIEDIPTDGINCLNETGDP